MALDGGRVDGRDRASEDASIAERARVADCERRIDWLATLFFVLAVLSLMLHGLTALNLWAFILSAVEHQLGVDESTAVFVVLFVVATQCVQVFAAVLLAGKLSYRWAWVAVGIGLCPLLTPLFILGFPLALWLATLLPRAEYRALFDSEPPFDARQDA